MPEEYLPNTAPDVRIKGIHTLDVLDGMPISRVEPTYKRIEPSLACGVEFPVFFCNNGIGGAVVIAGTVIIEVVFGGLSLIFGPLLGDRQSEYDRFLNITLIHVGNEISESQSLLEKVHDMDVRIDHRILRPTEGF